MGLQHAAAPSTERVGSQPRGVQVWPTPNPIQTLTPTLTLTLLALTLTLTLTSSGDVDVAIGEDSVAPPGDGGGGPESERGDGENFLARRPRRYPRPEVPPLEASEDAQPEGSNQYTI